MEIAKMLVLSTSHISLKTSQGFSGYLFPHYLKGDYGWIIPVVLTQQPNGCFAIANAEDYPGDLMQIMIYAYVHDCTWVMLDCDADVIADLPTYEW